MQPVEGLDPGYELRVREQLVNSERVQPARFLD